jgi:hypothetical protein
MKKQNIVRLVALFGVIAIVLSAILPALSAR